MSDEIQTLCDGKYLSLMKSGHWEYAERKNVSGAVAIVAVTPVRKIILVEQYRIPMRKHTIELPAGLAGDVAGSETEPLAEASRRELLEETGYAAERMTYLTEGPASAGLSNEVISMFLAEGLKKVSDGGGVDSEEIKIHEVPLANVLDWLNAQMKAGKSIDLKVYAGLYFAK